MSARDSNPADVLRRLGDALDKVRPYAQEAVGRIADDVAAAVFHAEHAADGGSPVVVLLGGTGTGKSTLANRLLDVPDRGTGAVTATSFRRTHTAGCVAIVKDDKLIPAGWLGIGHRPVPPDERPARGVPDRLSIVELESADLPIVLVDTPDLDGDVPEHHRQAERAFRWAQVVVLVATPEKYQLPEVPRYAALAGRYRLPRRFVMNKADDLAAPDDWARQIGREAHVYVVPRDDAALVVSEDRQLAALRRSLLNYEPPTEEDVDAGVRSRAGDVAGRTADGVLAPLARQRQVADEAGDRLRQLVRPESGVDVHPMTRHLQRRLRQQSVLYLMGPTRMFDRVRQMPSMLARLPRTSWDLFTKGKVTATAPTDDQEETVASGAPDFKGELVDSFRLLQSRCSDVLRDLNLPADEGGGGGGGGGGAEAWKIDPDEAGAIATRELGELQRWLEARWDSKPRDTRALEWLAKNIPGGKHITRLSETAPYLLVSLSLATSTVTAGVEQVVIGGYLLTTWLTERLSNEVAAKTRETNAAIGRGFEDLCDQQVKRAAEWADAQAPSEAQLGELEAAIEAAAEVAQQ